MLTARTDRIGHGVDVRHEVDYRELLRLMARRHVLVEVPLTSNAQVLGVTGPAHPRAKERSPSTDADLEFWFLSAVP